MKLLLLPILILSLLISPPTLAKEDINISTVQEQLWRYPDRQKVYNYIKKIKERIKEDPEDYVNYEALAIAYDQLRLYEKEVEVLELAIKYFPEDQPDKDMLYGNLSRAYLNLGKLDEAKPLIDKALQLNPDNIINHMHLLNYYVLKGQYKEAGSELKILSDFDKDEDFYYRLYYYAFNKIKDKVKIVELFKECVKANPDSHLPHRILAMAIRNSSLDDIERNLPVIMEELNIALELNPKFLPTYITIADTYMLLGEKTKNKAYFKDSLKWFKKARKLEPENIRLAYAMGLLFMSMEQYDKAIEKLEYVLNRGVNDGPVIDNLAHAYNNKAYTFYKKGKGLSRGLEIIDKAIKLKPNDGIILSTKAELLYKMGRLDEAYEYIKKGIALEPDQPEIKQDLENIEKAIREQNE